MVEARPAAPRRRLALVVIVLARARAAAAGAGAASRVLVLHEQRVPGRADRGERLGAQPFSAETYDLTASGALEQCSANDTVCTGRLARRLTAPRRPRARGPTRRVRTASG